MFDDTNNFDDHVSSFLSIVDELSSLDQQIQDTEKVTKMIRSLPPSFDALAMATSVNSLTFDQLVSAIQSNIERRNNSSRAHNHKNTVQAFLATVPGNFHPGRHNNRGQGSSSRGFRGGLGGRGGRCGSCRGFRMKERTCHYCGKSGHFIKFCRFRIQDEGNGRVTKPTHHCSMNFNNGSARNGNRGQSPSINPFNQDDRRQSLSRQKYLQPRQFGSNFENGGATAIFDDPPPHYDYRNNGHQARMARFRSKVESIGNRKVDDAYIDSSATHHFYYRRPSFSTYQNISP